MAYTRNLDGGLISDLSSHVEPAGWRGALQQVEGRLLAVLIGTCDCMGSRVSAGELGEKAAVAADGRQYGGAHTRHVWISRTASAGAAHMRVFGVGGVGGHVCSSHNAVVY